MNNNVFNVNLQTLESLEPSDGILDLSSFNSDNIEGGVFSSKGVKLIILPDNFFSKRSKVNKIAFPKDVVIVTEEEFIKTEENNILGFQSTDDLIECLRYSAVEYKNFMEKLPELETEETNMASQSQITDTPVNDKSNVKSNSVNFEKLSAKSCEDAKNDSLSGDVSSIFGFSKYPYVKKEADTEMSSDLNFSSLGAAENDSEYTELNISSFEKSTYVVNNESSRSDNLSSADSDALPEQRSDKTITAEPDITIYSEEKTPDIICSVSESDRESSDNSISEERPVTAYFMPDTKQKMAVSDIQSELQNYDNYDYPDNVNQLTAKYESRRLVKSSANALSTDKVNIKLDNLSKTVLNNADASMESDSASDIDEVVNNLIVDRVLKRVSKAYSDDSSDNGFAEKTNEDLDLNDLSLEAVQQTSSKDNEDASDSSEDESSNNSKRDAVRALHNETIENRVKNNVAYEDNGFKPYDTVPEENKIFICNNNESKTGKMRTKDIENTLVEFLKKFDSDEVSDTKNINSYAIKIDELLITHNAIVREKRYIDKLPFEMSELEKERDKLNEEIERLIDDIKARKMLKTADEVRVWCDNEVRNKSIDQMIAEMNTFNEDVDYNENSHLIKIKLVEYAKRKQQLKNITRELSEVEAKKNNRQFYASLIAKRDNNVKDIEAQKDDIAGLCKSAREAVIILTGDYKRVEKEYEGSYSDDTRLMFIQKKIELSKALLDFMTWDSYLAIINGIVAKDQKKKIDILKAPNPRIIKMYSDNAKNYLDNIKNQIVPPVSFEKSVIRNKSVALDCEFASIAIDEMMNSITKYKIQIGGVYKVNNEIDFEKYKRMKNFLIKNLKDCVTEAERIFGTIGDSRYDEYKMNFVKNTKGDFRKRYINNIALIAENNNISVGMNMSKENSIENIKNNVNIKNLTRSESSDMRRGSLRKSASKVKSFSSEKTKQISEFSDLARSISNSEICAPGEKVNLLSSGIKTRKSLCKSTPVERLPSKK